MTVFDVAWMATTLSCALVAGLVFGFAVVVMPGIATLSDKDFLRAFKAMDGIIQKGQPAFMVVWVGSIGTTISMLVSGTLQLSGVTLYGMWCAGGMYLLTVQGPTIRFNIPLNNAVQSLDIDALDASELVEARRQFEAPWNRWNRLRTVTAILSVTGLLGLQLWLR